MKNENMRTVLFDFDGTIADTMTNIINLYNQLAIKNKFKIVDNTNLHELRNKNALEVIKTLEIPLRKVPIIANKIRKQLKAKLDEVIVFEGMRETLITLKDMNYKIGIISTNNIKNIVFFIKQNNIDYFDFIFSCKDLFGKHHAINKMIKKKHLNKDTLVYVADEIRDIDACNKIGIKIISVCWGYNNKDAFINKNPAYIAENPKDILNLL